MSQIAETGCCPRFDPDPWDEKEVTWHGRPFVRDRVRSILHIPLNFGRVMTRNMTAIEQADAKDPDCVVLSDENSLWGADVYISVTKEVPGLRNARLSGTFFTKTFEGPYSQCRKWVKQMQTLLEARGKACTKLLFYYTTCPRCAKAYGANYVVLLARQ